MASLGSEAETLFARITGEIAQLTKRHLEIQTARTNISIRKKESEQRIVEFGHEIQGIKDEWLRRLLLLFPYVLCRAFNLCSAWREEEDVKISIKSEEEQLTRFLAEQHLLIKQAEAAKQSHRQAAIQRARELEGWCQIASRRLLVQQNDQVEACFAQCPAYIRGRFEPGRWKDFVPAADSTVPAHLTVGDLVEDAIHDIEPIRLPFVLPWARDKATMVVLADPPDSAKAQGVFLAVALRAAAIFAHSARFTFLDPHTQGLPFRTLQELKPLLRSQSGNTSRDLEAVVEDVARIVRTLLNGTADSFEKLPLEVRQNEKWELIFVSTFPKGFASREVELVKTLSRTGPFAGKYLVMLWDAATPIPSHWNDAGFGPVQVVDVTKDGQVRNGFRLELTTLPPQAIVESIVARVISAKPSRCVTPISKLLPASSRDWWKGNAAVRVSAPIGLASTGKPLWLTLGVADDGRIISHGAIAGETGSGKSRLYHAIIVSICTHYGPHEVVLILIDGKNGVEMGVYEKLPHARVVVLQSEPEYVRDVLAHLVEEIVRRNGLFSRAGVVDFAAYRKAGEPFGHLHRIIVIIDEYQAATEGDFSFEASRCFLALVQKGRSAGISLLLGSQQYGCPNLLNLAGIFGNIQLRVGLKMALAARANLTEFGPEGRRLLADCDRPGKMVLNAQSGDDGANSVGQAALVSTEESTALVAQFQRKALAELPSHQDCPPIVINGKSQPDFIEHPLAAHLMKQGSRISSAQWESLIRKPTQEGGLGPLDCNPAEHPFALPVGRPLKIYGHTQIVCSRRSGSHILIIGGNCQAHQGMTCAMAASLGLVAHAQQSIVHLLDLGHAGPTSNDFQFATEILRVANCETTNTNEPAKAQASIECVYAELARRKAMSREDCASLPSVFLFVLCAERLTALHRQTGKLGVMTDSALGANIREILQSGAELGIHLACSFSMPLNVTQVFERNAFEVFQHRVLFQMEEADAFQFGKNRLASQLQTHGTRPIRALYANPGAGISMIFKPYVLETTQGSGSPFSRIAQLLKSRSAL